MLSTTSKLESALVAFIREQLFTGHDSVGLHEPSFSGREREYVVDAIDSTFVSSVGQYVDAFEKTVASFTGAARAVATVNGTAALHTALHLLGVQPGDEVLTQPLTFVATANAVRYCGACPVFVDIDYDTLGLSPDAVAQFLQQYGEPQTGERPRNRSTGRRIAACLPMHSYGFPLRIAELVSACADWGIPVIEDAAESLGSFVGQTHTGLFGELGVLSFNGNKTVTTGGGGMIITRDSALADRAKHITTTAKVAHRWEYVHDELGFNYRMPNLNAALGCAQLEQLDQKLAKKRRIAAAYSEFFARREWSNAGYQLMVEREGTRANYWLNTLLCPDRAARDALLQYTNDNGVMTRPAWELMYRLPEYRGSLNGGCPVAEDIGERLVNLPSSPRGELRT
ncbi:MAG: LegC family aminotransferase [Spirochaetaceae bacterium]|nr:MAG: LegC family aminotransferase [Spirochaetaceae bacterium]